MADNNEIFDLLTKMYSEMQEMKSDFGSRFDKLENRMDSLEKQVTKNSITLEKLDNNIKLLAEGQEAFKEQLGRADIEDKRTVTDRLETIEMAVTHTAKSVNTLSETIEVVKDTAASNNLDIKILKRLQKTSM